MTNCTKRILAGAAMVIIAGGAAVAEHFGIPVVRILSIIIVLGMIAELIIVIKKLPKNKCLEKSNLITFVFSFAWLLFMLAAAYFVGARPWVVLLLILVISFADIGGWFFGRHLGGDKMWERLSAGKTWAGQIAGIACGTFAAVMYGLLGTDTFLPQLLWIGISISLLSQYGDLTASWIKRKIGIKDFGNILPGHGGLLDRFDGWIYVLPLVWLVML
ncbi:MAG: CDP-archaeol synthase [Alphaproteobacteria bacterium]|nr:CDP-archaeol synthase [Alphaproteobacteria bacterium]MBN2675378.1 CDP-archaeol synthase [Alphaproteobacteria bacterium]